jgi:hypothetical protein
MIPTLAEEEMLHDGEPVFAMAWGEGPSHPYGPVDLDRLGSSRTINHNIAAPSTVTPEADQ